MNFFSPIRPESVHWIGFYALFKNLSKGFRNAASPKNKFMLESATSSTLRFGLTPHVAIQHLSVLLVKMVGTACKARSTMYRCEYQMPGDTGKLEVLILNIHMKAELLLLV